MIEYLFPHMSAASNQQIARAQPEESGSTLISQVTDYWASLPRHGGAPQRSSVQAADLTDALPHIFLAQIVTTRIARFRIVGHQIEDLMGMEMRGMPLTALFTGDARSEIQSAVTHVRRGARVMLSLDAETGFGMPKLDAVLALLPLTDSSGTITHLMGVLERSGTSGRRPRRFALAQPCEVSPAEQPQSGKPALRVIQGGLG
ncbi:MAG: PAS domain-containing protein [Rhodobacteraceae bacterium]|nr:PAS domain-containing protein [Paracoccaceae bacterium]